MGSRGCCSSNWVSGASKSYRVNRHSNGWVIAS